MDNDINNLIERIKESGFKSITMEDEDIIIHCLKHSLEIFTKQWKEDERNERNRKLTYFK
jgi:hypothetical protein